MMWKALWQWGIAIQVSIYTPLAANDQQLNCKKSFSENGKSLLCFGTHSEVRNRCEDVWQCVMESGFTLT